MSDKVPAIEIIERERPPQTDVIPKIEAANEPRGGGLIERAKSVFGVFRRSRKPERSAQPEVDDAITEQIPQVDDAENEFKNHMLESFLVSLRHSHNMMPSEGEFKKRRDAALDYLKDPTPERAEELELKELYTFDEIDRLQRLSEAGIEPVVLESKRHLKDEYFLKDRHGNDRPEKDAVELTQRQLLEPQANLRHIHGERGALMPPEHNDHLTEMIHTPQHVAREKRHQGRAAAQSKSRNV